MRVVNIALALSLVAGSAVVGCGGKNTTSTVGGTSPKSAAKQDLAYLPINSDVVVTLDAAAVRSSGLYTRLAPKMLAQISSEMAEVKKHCGFDPVTQINGITVGLRPAASADQKPVGVIIAHGLREADITKCFNGLSAEEQNEIHLRKDGAVWTFGEAEMSAVFGFVAADTLLIVLDANVAALGPAEFVKATSSESSVLSSPGFAAAWAATPVGQMRVLMNANSGWFASMRDQVPGAKMIGFGASMSTEIVGSVSVSFDTAERAKAMVDQLQPLLGIAQAAVGAKLEVRQDNDRVVLHGTLPSAAVDKVLQQM